MHDNTKKILTETGRAAARPYKIMQTLSYFATLPFIDALKQFFADDLQLPFNALGDDPVRLADILPDPPAYTQNIADVYAVGLVNDDAFSGNPALFAETTLAPKRYDGIVILGVTLKTPENALPKRGELAQIARAFNRAFHATPVMVVFKYQDGKSTFIALANTERGEYKQQWREGEKAGRVSLLRDIEINNVHPGHRRILDELKVPDHITSFAALYEYWQKVLDVSLLNKDFYRDLSNWFFAARQFAQFPDPAENATERGLIRLITRLIFTWFIKERRLVPEALFDKNHIQHLLTDTAPESDTYYRAVLQNLFFATLNTEMGTRRFRDEKRDAQNRNKDYGLHQYFRYKSTFTDADEWLALIKNVPFLNGGLFECLDPEDKDGQRIDGFSDNPKRQAHLPNKLFWGDDWEANLSDIYNSKKQQSAKVRPLLNLLHSYKFTIAENTPLEQDVALDPELLGKVFENLVASYNPETKTTARKQTGSFYTPREIVNYMVEEALYAHLTNSVNNDGNKSTFNDKLKVLLSDDDHQNAAELDFTPEEIQRLVHAINHCTILDPACGSGAFPMGALSKMVLLLNKLDPDNKIWLNSQLAAVDKALEATGADGNAINEAKQSVRDAFAHNDPDYARKLYLIQNCLFGVDIQPIALQISKLRFFIALVIDQKIDDDKPNRGIRALPNLETKFVAADTLIALPEQEQKTLADIHANKELDEAYIKLSAVRRKHVSPRSRAEKKQLEARDKALRLEIEGLMREAGFGDSFITPVVSWNPYNQNAVADFFDPERMFGTDLKEGFDIVTGNPPYISTKGISADVKKKLELQYGFADDAYSHFFFRGIDVLKAKGVLTFITSKTFWTTQTKKNLRDMILSYRLNYIFDTANPFESVMVDTCVLSLTKEPDAGELVPFIDGSKDLQHPVNYLVRQNTFLQMQNNVIFKPTIENLNIQELYGKKVKELSDIWWDKISTSKNISKYRKDLEHYRANLQPGDIALLGCLTEGGQGLATGNNGKYIAVKKSSKWARNVLESRPKKLFKAINQYGINIDGLENFEDIKRFVNSMSEREIEDLFDGLKEKYGRDIFGQGYLFRLVSDDEIADVDQLTEEEKVNGIDPSKKFYVPYDKGDKDGNRWYLETPFAIAWTKQNVGFLKTDPRARFQGNQFYFREGFCWTNILNPQAKLLKSKLKSKSVNDVGSMSLYSVVEAVPNFYLITLLNSEILFRYYREFINCTVNIQINDIRQLPIRIPNTKELDDCKQFFDQIITQKTNPPKSGNVNRIERSLNRVVEDLYLQI